MKDALDENSGKYIQLHPADNVLVALQDLIKGSSVPLGDALIFLQDDISAKHKFFTTPMRQGDGVTMYGVLVGRVQHDLPAGSVMTVHNTVHAVEGPIPGNLSMRMYGSISKKNRERSHGDNLPSWA